MNDTVRETPPDELAQRNPLMRLARARERGHNARQIEIDYAIVFGMSEALHPQPLCFGVSLDNLAVLPCPSGEMQVLDRGFIYREERRRCAVFRRHVRNGRAIGHGQASDAGTVKL